MNKKHSAAFSLLILLFTASLLSCRDLIEKDISNAEIVIISPNDNIITDSYSVIFWWNEVGNVQKYRIQIVKPSFDTLQSIITDTLISGTKLAFALIPGKYQWRIRAENGSSYSAYTTRNITIDTNSNLSGQIFNTEYPVDDHYTNALQINFRWLPYPYATSYEYTLLDANGTIAKIKTTTATNVTDTLSAGIFTWKVRAHNANNNTYSEYSTLKKITIDISTPPASQHISPEENALASNPITIVWQRGQGIAGDSIIVGSDSLFQNITLRQYFTSDTSYTFQPLTINNTYYWKIKSKDKANNWSNYNSFRRFTVTF